ncbi:hypothetical protein ACQ9LF_10305 [Anaerohalosphaeraceae bacterium U12dextr]
MDNAQKPFKLVVKQDVIYLVVGDQMVKLDDWNQEIEEKAFQLIRDNAVMQAFLNEYAHLSNQIASTDEMKKEVKSVAKLLGKFIHKYNHLYKTKEYKQAISKLRNELDRAFDV